jgi:hypothetical protein
VGTKNNPGQYDCYAKAEPDEPIFTLRGKDVSAPYLVQLWTFVRRGEFDRAARVVESMKNDPRILALVGECEKFDEALDCALAMREWRNQLDNRAQPIK